MGSAAPRSEYRLGRLPQDAVLTATPPKRQVSTVTYLTRGGAPTVILGARVSRHGQLLPSLPVSPAAHPSVSRPAPPSVSAWISQPRVRKLLRFDGGLLHGCPPVLSEPSPPHSGRLTLLVNVWRNHTPVGLRPLPPGTALRLRCRTRASRQLLALRPPAEPTQRGACGRKRKRDLHGAQGGNRDTGAWCGSEAEGGCSSAGGDSSPLALASGLRPAARLRVPVCDGSRELRLALPLPERGGEQGGTSEGAGRGSGAVAEGGRGAAGGGRGLLGMRPGGVARVSVDASTVACGQLRCGVRRL